MAAISPKIPQNAPPAFHLLAKPTGATCKLDCTYCFFLSKEMLYPGSRFHMADELLELYIKQLLEAYQVPEVTIAWQGGEPTLMGLDFFKRLVEYVEKHRKPGQTVLHTIQTNGTRIDFEMAAFFEENNFLVGLSVDGPREMHDAYRVDKGGKGTFDQVLRGWENLRKHAVEFNSLRRTTSYISSSATGLRSLLMRPKRRSNAPRISCPRSELATSMWLAGKVATTATTRTWLTASVSCYLFTRKRRRKRRLAGMAKRHCERVGG